MTYIYDSFPNLILDFLLSHKSIKAMHSRSWQRFIDREKASKRKVAQTIYNLKRRGSLNVLSKKGQKFLEITQRGRLEVLIAKAIKYNKIQKWDGKWRIIMFDIPEDWKIRRTNFRRLLIKNNFIKLQASVYISPFPLHRDAILYLTETGLISFIRIIKAEEIDNDTDLRKKFNL